MLGACVLEASIYPGEAVDLLVSEYYSGQGLPAMTKLGSFSSEEQPLRSWAWKGFPSARGNRRHRFRLLPSGGCGPKT